jgi:hypothetical protein
MKVEWTFPSAGELLFALAEAFDVKAKWVLGWRSKFPI